MCYQLRNWRSRLRFRLFFGWRSGNEDLISGDGTLPVSRPTTLTAKTVRIAALIAVTAGILTFNLPAARAEVSKEAVRLNGETDSVPAYSWRDDTVAPRAVLIALHGSVQHAGNFATLAEKLAPQGVIVYAIDLRGHGDWVVAGRGRPRVDYAGSARDLVQLTAQVRDKHPGLPVFVIGESVGAAVAINALSESPRLFDGMILASPGSKPTFVGHNIGATLRTALGAVKSLGQCVDLTAHLKNISDDPRSADEMVFDPRIRKHASLGDLLRTINFIRTSDDLARKLNKDVPVLVIQGGSDDIIQASSSEALYSKLATKDKSILKFPKVGHLLVTTAFLKPEVVSGVEGWLFARTRVTEPLAVTATQPMPTKNSVDSLVNTPSLEEERGPLRD